MSPSSFSAMDSTSSLWSLAARSANSSPMGSTVCEPSGAKRICFISSTSMMVRVPLPPGSWTGIAAEPKRSCTRASAPSKSESPVSSLFSTNIAGVCVFSVYDHPSSVPTWTPSEASSTKMAVSATLSAVMVSAEKSRYPGVSSTLILCPFHSAWSRLVNTLMPRSCSESW